MARQGSRVVLASRADRGVTAACEKALIERGVEVVKVYDCWSAEVAQQAEGAEAVVIDGRVLCAFVSAERPGPILGSSSKLPVVVFNARELDEQHRSAAMAQNATIVDGEDVEEIARCLGQVLPPA